MQKTWKEEFRDFAMDVEFLLRKKPKWRKIVQMVVFQEGDWWNWIKKAEEAED